MKKNGLQGIMQGIMRSIKRTGFMVLVAGISSVLFSACGEMLPGEKIPASEKTDIGTVADIRKEADAQAADAGEAPDAVMQEATDISEAALSARADIQHGYYYEQLSGEEQVWYREIYAILDDMSEEKSLSAEENLTVGEEGLDRIFQCVMNDHPELFYVEGYTYTLYTYGAELVKISMAGTYTMTAIQRAEKEAQIEETVADCLAGIAPEASDYDKVKYVYEYVINRTSYNREAADNQNICSVFIGKESVCQGYAKAVQYLLQRLGIKSTLVIGKVNGTESHAWNLVEVDGEYYYLDATWGDASYVNGEGYAAVSVFPGINYDYLNITTAELEKSHIAESVVEMPVCTATAANYYVREGAYFTSYDADALKELFEKGDREGRIAVTFRCSDKETYDIFYEELITGQQIFSYLDSTDGQVAFSQDTDKLSMTFWLVNE